MLSGYREVNLKANCVLALASVGSNEKRWQQKYAMDCNMNFGIRLEGISLEVKLLVFALFIFIAL